MKAAIADDRYACWDKDALLTLRNTHVGALQDHWESKNANSWPELYELEGFTYDRLGSIGPLENFDLLNRPVTHYIRWLDRNLSSSAQPYEQLAGIFSEAGEPYKSADIQYAARERRRRKAWSNLAEDGQIKKWEWLHALGLLLLSASIGYGLGHRYFRILWWVSGLTLVGAVVLFITGQSWQVDWIRVIYANLDMFLTVIIIVILTMCLVFDYSLSCYYCALCWVAGGILVGSIILISAVSNGSVDWLSSIFASLDQLLPIITLDKAHDVMIFGNTSVKPPVAPLPYWVLIYFYVHKIIGWVLGSFLIAGLAGLTQRN